MILSVDLLAILSLFLFHVFLFAFAGMYVRGILNEFMGE